MTALSALIRRDIRIALRVGGGALIGVLFFLTVTVLMPFAVGRGSDPRSSGWARCSPAS
jgi:heme exporter protein B